MRSNHCLSLLLIAFACVAAPQVRAEVIISEIMYNPAGSDRDDAAVPPYNREWIELYNTGQSTINLGGWQLGDSQDNTWAAAFPAGTLIESQQALVVTGDAATFDAQWGGGIHRVQVANFPTWANDPSPTNETVAIRDGFGVIRDAVNYDDERGWPRVTGSDGQSIFLLPSGLTSGGNDLGINWAPSVWGAYGARFRPGEEENHGSPGLVVAVPQPPFTPSPDAAWSMVILPDTQNYAKSSVDKHVFTQQTAWIRDNRDAFNIQVVLHEGDIVNNNNTNNPSTGNQTSAQQWQNAQDSMFVLNGHVPYILATGNHDYGTTNAQNRSTNINNYFRASDNPLVDPAQGGILRGVMTPGEIQNAYYEFAAPDGREMLIIALEWEPRPATVSWANQIAALPEYAGHTAVLLTHAYLLGGNTRYVNSSVAADYSGEELWQGLVRHHENFEMTFNGHFGGDGAGYLRSLGDEGNAVHQMFFNTQFETHGGDGWLRVLEFLEDGTTVRVRTYSPLWDMTRTHAQFEFEFEISPLPAVPSLPGDYNVDGVVDVADYVVWRDTLDSATLDADGNGDGAVNELDYFVWRQNFGRNAAALAAANHSSLPLPEPSSVVIAVVLAAFCQCRRGCGSAAAGSTPAGQRRLIVYSDASGEHSSPAISALGQSRFGFSSRVSWPG